MSSLDNLTGRKIKQNRFFTTLDGLRGIAALCIAIRHAPYLWGNDHHPTEIFQESYLAVDFFFVLSGFILAFAYRDRLSTNMKFKEFVFARTLRLYPLYVMSVILSVPYIAWSAVAAKTSYEASAFATIAMLFMLPNPLFNNALFPYNLVVWSLFFENVANIIFGAFTKLLTPGFLIVYLTISGSFLALSVQQNWLGFGSGNGPMDAGPTWESFGAGLLRVMYSFFAGVFVYHLHERNVMRMAVNPLLVCLPLLLALISYPPSELAGLFDLACTIVVFPLIVLIGSYNNPTKVLSKFFEFIGSLSYGMYVLQIPIYVLCTTLFYKILGDNIYLHPISLGLLSVLVMIFMSTVSFYAYDYPVRKWLGKRHKNRSRRPSALLEPSVGSS